METGKSVWMGKGGGMITEATGGESPFVVRRAKEWRAEAKERPAPRMLFGEFWLEGELAIMFADTGQGKSILAVQIAESLAAGRSIEPLRCTAAAQKVLYFDFELTDK